MGWKHNNFESFWLLLCGLGWLFPLIFVNRFEEIYKNTVTANIQSVVSYTTDGHCIPFQITSSCKIFFTTNGYIMKRWFNKYKNSRLLLFFRNVSFELIDYFTYLWRIFSRNFCFGHFSGLLLFFYCSLKLPMKNAFNTSDYSYYLLRAKCTEESE